MALFCKKKKLNIQKAKNIIKCKSEIPQNLLTKHVLCAYVKNGNGRLGKKEYFLCSPIVEGNKTTSYDLILLTGNSAGKTYKNFNIDIAQDGIVRLDEYRFLNLVESKGEILQTSAKPLILSYNDCLTIEALQRLYFLENGQFDELDK